MSQKLRKALSINGGHLVHMINYIGTLPDISEHSNHPIGEVRGHIIFVFDMRVVAVKKF